MTKVQLAYDLVRPLTDDDAKAISAVHSYYGMTRVKMTPALNGINVEFDASRLTEKEVESVLHGFGIAIKRKWDVP